MPSSHNAKAAARVACPHRVTSPPGVNQRRAYIGPCEAKASAKEHLGTRSDRGGQGSTVNICWGHLPNTWRAFEVRNTAPLFDTSEGPTQVQSTTNSGVHRHSYISRHSVTPHLIHINCRSTHLLNTRQHPVPSGHDTRYISATIYYPWYHITRFAPGYYGISRYTTQSILSY